MRSRPFASLLVVASLLHLNFVRADATCRDHDHGAAHGDVADHGTTHHAAGAKAAHGDPSSDATPAPCDTPEQPECCQALASCSAALESWAQLAADTAAAQDGGVVGALIDTPLSRVSTPDPPPPRA